MEGLTLLGSLREKWSKLIVFFCEMVKIIKVSMNEPLNRVIEYSKGIQSNGAQMSKIMCDVIYSTARQAVGYGYVVNRMSQGYFEISKNYLMDPVEKLTLICKHQSELNTM